MKVQASDGTVMCSIFWDAKGVLLIDFMLCAGQAALLKSEFKEMRHPPNSPDLTPLISKF